MNSYTPTFRQSRDMDAFLESQKLQKLEQEEIENLERPITREEIETLIKNLPRHKSPESDVFPGEFYETFKEETIRILLKLWKDRKRWSTSKFVL